MKLQEYVVSCKMNRLGLAHLEQAKLRAEGVMRSEIGAKILLRDHDFETAGTTGRYPWSHSYMYSTVIHRAYTCGVLQVETREPTGGYYTVDTQMRWRVQLISLCLCDSILQGSPSHSDGRKRTSSYTPPD